MKIKPVEKEKNQKEERIKKTGETYTELGILAFAMNGSIGKFHGNQTNSPNINLRKKRKRKRKRRRIKFESVNERKLVTRKGRTMRERE